MNRRGVAVSVEPLSPLDERYIANIIMLRVMTATATLFLDAASLLTPDGSFDETGIRRRIDAATWSAPALRKRLMRAPRGGPAAWVPVERLDLDYHVSFHPDVLADDGPSTRVLAGRSLPNWDVRRPMWRIQFARMGAAKAALVFTWQHVLGDAAYGLEILRRLFDSRPGTGMRVVADDDRMRLGRAPSSRAEFSHAVRELARTGGGDAPIGRRVRRRVARAVRPARDALIVGSGALRRLPAKEFRVLRFDLGAAERFAHDHGGSLTDLIVALTFSAIFRSRPALDSGSLLVPISRRAQHRDGGERNVMSATLVTVSASGDVAALIPAVRQQIAAGVRGSALSDGSRFGYATMVPTGESDRWFGDARIESVAGWPAGDPRDGVAVLACTFEDELTVAISADVGADIVGLAASMDAAMPTRGVRP